MARGTVLRGSMISPADAAMAEKPKKVMNASAATEIVPTGSTWKLPANSPSAGPTPTLANIPPMKKRRTTTFALVTRSWNVPDSSVPRALRMPRRTATSTPNVPCGRKWKLSGIRNRKNHSSIVAR